jgi:hypothetical protein
MKLETKWNITLWAMIVTTIANVLIAGSTNHSIIFLVYILASIGLWKLLKT